MNEYNIWQTNTRASLDYIIREILKDRPYAITGGFAVQVYSYAQKDRSFKRNTKDIDIVVPKEYKSEILEILNKKKIAYKNYKSSVRDSLDIIVKDGPKFSISFTDRMPEYESVQIKLNGIKEVNVESLESLLVNKFATYLFRTEEKDIQDIFQIVKLLRQKKVDMYKIINAMKNYNIIEDSEKMFFVFMEYYKLIASSKDYVDISDEEKNKILYYLKAKKLII